MYRLYGKKTTGINKTSPTNSKTNLNFLSLIILPSDSKSTKENKENRYSEKEIERIKEITN